MICRHRKKGLKVNLHREIQPKNEKPGINYYLEAPLCILGSAVNRLADRGDYK